MSYLKDMSATVILRATENHESAISLFKATDTQIVDEMDSMNTSWNANLAAANERAEAALEDMREKIEAFSKDVSSKVESALSNAVAPSDDSLEELNEAIKNFNDNYVVKVDEVGEKENQDFLNYESEVGGFAEFEFGFTLQEGTYPGAA